MVYWLHEYHLLCAVQLVILCAACWRASSLKRTYAFVNTLMLLLEHGAHLSRAVLLLLMRAFKPIVTCRVLCFFCWCMQCAGGQAG
jgi:hypothetical protein